MTECGGVFECGSETEACRPRVGKARVIGVRGGELQPPRLPDLGRAEWLKVRLRRARVPTATATFMAIDKGRR